MAPTDGYRIIEQLATGAWTIQRGQAPDGTRLIVTTVAPPIPDDMRARLELPFEGIPPLHSVTTVERDGQPHTVVVEAEPRGYAIGDLKWPLPIGEVITVGLDLARLLSRMHAAGVVHGSLRPQTTWIDTVDGRSRLTGTTPRPELAGMHTASKTGNGNFSPFAPDLFCPDVLAKGDPPSVSSDVAQLGMMLYRMLACRSPFARGHNEPVTEQLVRVVQGELPEWPAGDARTRAVEQLGRAAFDPARAGSRALAPLLEGLETLARQ